MTGTIGRLTVPAALGTLAAESPLKGEPLVIRRIAFLPLALVATLAVVLAACGSTPAAAPALTDPKEIVTKGVTSLVDVKSFEFTGTFSGTATAPGAGSFDLKDIKMSGAVDVANKAAKFTLDAPAIAGTNIDAVVVGNTAYYKVAGALALMANATADKYTKVELPNDASNPAVAATDVTKLVSALQVGLAQLPVQPTKAPDDRCSDQDCYHVTLTLTKDQLAAFGAGSTADGDVTVDLFTRKSDYRPGKIALSVASASMGTFGAAIDLKYDTSVSIVAPPPDQIAP